MTTGDAMSEINGGRRLVTASYWYYLRGVEEHEGDVFVPVRTSIGTPRMQLGYELVEFCGSIAPYGCNFKGPADQFKKQYLARLEKKGAPHIGSRLKDIAEKYEEGATLVILCYEKLTPAMLAKDPDHFCHRRLFADWFGPKIGMEIPDFDMLYGEEPPEGSGIQEKML